MDPPPSNHYQLLMLAKACEAIAAAAKQAMSVEEVSPTAARSQEEAGTSTLE